MPNASVLSATAKCSATHYPGINCQYVLRQGPAKGSNLSQRTKLVAVGHHEQKSIRFLQQSQPTSLIYSIAIEIELIGFVYQFQYAGVWRRLVPFKFQLGVKVLKESIQGLR